MELINYKACSVLTFTVGSLVGLRADTELAGAAEGVPGAVIVPDASLHTDAAGWIGWVNYRSRRAAALVGAGQVLAGDSKAAGAD